MIGLILNNANSLIQIDPFVCKGLPAINVIEELVKRCSLYGDVSEHRKLDGYPCEEFTEVHLIKFAKIQAAR